MSAAEAQAGIGRTLALDPAGLSAERLNRRFGACEVAAPIENNHVSEPAYKEVGAACEYAHTLWPNANAAILSVRGQGVTTVRTAIGMWPSLPKRTSCCLAPSVAFLIYCESVRKLTFRHWRYRRRGSARAQTLLATSRHRLREGRLIAVYCEWPEIESEPILKPVDYLGWRSGALRRVASASKNLALTIDLARKSNVQSELGDFVAASSDAAERFAKIAFGKLTSGTGVQIPKRHQINEIVDILDRVMEQNIGPDSEWWQSDRGKKFRDLLRIMNGHGYKDRQFGYFNSEIDAHDIDRAVQRLIATVSFAIMEAEDLPGSGDLRDAAREVAGNYCKSIQDEASFLRRTLQNIDSNNLTYSTADSDIVESVSMAASFGEEIAQALEKLADSLHAESENHA